MGENEVDLGVIGTAFRGKDRAFLSKALWNSVVRDFYSRLAQYETPPVLVSGASAGCDFLAVQAYIDGLVPNVHLMGVGVLDRDGFQYRVFDRQQNTARFVAYVKHIKILNAAHRAFSEIVGIDSIRLTYQAVCNGVQYYPHKDFFERNNELAKGCKKDLLAYSFGVGQEPTDGGTLNTWRAHREQHPDSERIHVSLVEVLAGIASRSGGSVEAVI